MSFRTYFRRNAYRWHRITSMIVALPVLLWTISGFLHPVMNSSKPQVRNQSLAPATIDPARISIPLAQALAQNGIGHIRNFRIVKLYEVFYYQVQLPGVDTPTYINCASGTTLIDGDRNYAAYLAQRFLYAQNSTGQKQEGHHHTTAAILPVSFSGTRQLPEKARVRSVRLLRRFDAEYKAGNKLLPVYRVAFDRADSIRLYIETPADRLALAVDQRKAWFTRFFSLAHSWSFLNGMGKTKNLLLGGCSLLCFVSGILGCYVYNITGKKKRKPGVPFTKSTHRILGNIFMVTTLLYAASGAWHSLQKITPHQGAQETRICNRFSAQEADLNIQALMRHVPAGEVLQNVSLVRMHNTNYWQATTGNRKESTKRYYDAVTLTELKEGDTKYGCYLACRFSQQQHRDIRHSRCLTAFNHDYSMMNKRLPVMEVGFDNNNYFVETTTGTLAAVSNSASRGERFSFSNFHMHHYWERWLGKTTGSSLRNATLIASTLGLLLVALTGMLLYAKRKRMQ